MRVYTAGFYLALYTWSKWESVPKETYPDWVLESYATLSRKTASRIRQHKQSIFIDSGAFSVHSRGAKIELDDYIGFIEDHRDIIHLVANLDVIAPNSEKLSYKNLETLRKRGIEAYPVHHLRDGEEWLPRYIKDGYDYICLGGLPPKGSITMVRSWLDKMWSKYLIDDKGKPICKIHGFGLTSIELMCRYPWFSVDSTAWVKASRFGDIYIDLPNRSLRLNISDKSPRMGQFGQHYDTLTGFEQKQVTKRVEELGYTVEELRDNFRRRDQFNVQFFNRVQARGTDTFKVPNTGGLF